MARGEKERKKGPAPDTAVHNGFTDGSFRGRLGRRIPRTLRRKNFFEKGGVRLPE